jgi:hypothetical protein
MNLAQLCRLRIAYNNYVPLTDMTRLDKLLLLGITQHSFDSLFTKLSVLNNLSALSIQFPGVLSSMRLRNPFHNLPVNLKALQLVVGGGRFGAMIENHCSIYNNQLLSIIKDRCRRLEILLCTGVRLSDVDGADEILKNCGNLKIAIFVSSSSCQLWRKNSGFLNVEEKFKLVWNNLFREYFLM